MPKRARTLTTTLETFSANENTDSIKTRISSYLTEHPQQRAAIDGIKSKIKEELKKFFQNPDAAAEFFIIQMIDQGRNDFDAINTNLHQPSDTTISKFFAEEFKRGENVRSSRPKYQKFSEQADQKKQKGEIENAAELLLKLKQEIVAVGLEDENVESKRQKRPNKSEQDALNNAVNILSNMGGETGIIQALMGEEQAEVNPAKKRRITWEDENDDLPNIPPARSFPPVPPANKIIFKTKWPQIKTRLEEFGKTYQEFETQITNLKNELLAQASKTYVNAEDVANFYLAQTLDLTTQVAKGSNYGRVKYQSPPITGEGQSRIKTAATSLITAISQSNRKENDAHLNLILANSYLLGIGVDETPDIAWKYMIKAASKGSAIAQYTLGKKLEREVEAANHESAINYVNAIEPVEVFYKSAAKQGLSAALYNLGNIYENIANKRFDPVAGKSDEENKVLKENIENDCPTLALYWYKESAALGNVAAQFKLGIYYTDLQNNELSIHYFRQAAEKGVTLAYYKLGDIYADRATTAPTEAEREEAEALSLVNYKTAAERGHKASQYIMQYHTNNNTGSSIELADQDEIDDILQSLKMISSIRSKEALKNDGRIGNLIKNNWPLFSIDKLADIYRECAEIGLEKSLPPIISAMQSQLNEADLKGLISPSSDGKFNVRFENCSEEYLQETLPFLVPKVTIVRSEKINSNDANINNFNSIIVTLDFPRQQERSQSSSSSSSSSSIRPFNATALAGADLTKTITIN